MGDNSRRVLGLILALLSVAGPCDRVARADIVVTNCYVSLLKDVEVSAEAPGVIVALNVHEGQYVKQGDLLANIDDRQMQANKTLAKIELESAHEQADNDVRVRYAREDARVSQAELDAAMSAQKLRPGTFGESEMRKMRLQLSRSTLGIEQAVLEQKQLIHAARASAAKLQAADDEISRRAIQSPLSGVVVEIREHQGEWVGPGDPILRIVLMDRLSIDGFLNVNQDGGQVSKGMAVVATVNTGSRQVEARGEVSFVSPIVQAGGDYRVRVEVENVNQNGRWQMRPGLPATFRILTR